MISILIPTFNYNTYPLVIELKRQCDECLVLFEIIVQDDASNSVLNKENNKINLLNNCFFYENENNLGRARNRNSLVKKANFDWVLFLDCDVFPKGKDFIQNYLNCIDSNYQVVFGGISYYEKKPLPNEMLRWVYGKNREAKPLKKRIQEPYKCTLTSNILLKKEIFKENSFPREIINYGFEDTVFIEKLKKLKIIIHQIENSVYHLKLDTSLDFINKYESSMRNLKMLIDTNYINPNEILISKAYYKLRFFRLDILYVFLFKFIKFFFLKNLLSNNPSLLIFDLYRLNFFCKINS